MEKCIFLKILEPSKMHNSMKTLVFGQNQRNMTYAFSAASRKANKYAFSHGKMHISEKSWSHQKCIIPWKPWFLDKINEIWNMHFLQPAEKQKNMHFPMAYFWKILEPSKMHIENAYFLRAIKNACWKCIFFACYFYGRSKMHNGSGRPTFLICTVSPKAVRGWSFDLCILNFQHAHHDAKTFWVQKLPGNITQTSQSLDWNNVIETRFPFFDLVLTRN